jgi:putative NIF3 family GTP cyclohydrolase 1 type 2
MLVPERELRSVAAAVLEAHPYEEVAYDIYPLRNPGMMYGRGRIGELPLEVSLETVLAQVQDALELRSEQAVRCSHQTGQPVGVLAVASGAAPGTELLQAAQRQQAGVLVTGGAMLSDLALAEDSDTVLVDVGFAPSVAPGLQRLVAQLRDTFGSERLHIAYVP